MQRIVTGLIALIIAIFFIYLGGWWFLLIVTALAALGIFEMYRALKLKHPGMIVWPAYVLLGLAIPAVIIYDAFGLVVLFCACAFATLCAPVFSEKVTLPDAMASIFCLVYPTLPFTFFYVLSECSQTEELARVGVILALFGAIAADVFGIYSGKFFGRHKLAPRVSPKKTVEGAIGGGVMSMVVCIVIGILFSQFYSDAPPLWTYAAVGVLVAFASITGDLIASAVKRYCEIKDFGKLFPGHGGVMDRFDSILFSALVIVCFYSLSYMF